MTIGEKIQTCRKRLNLSQEELGQKLLVSRQTISLWEKDQTVPTIDNLVRLREIFGVSVDEMLGIEAAEQIQETLPIESYRFAYSKEEVKEIYRLQRKSIYKKPILFTVICILLIVFFIGTSAPDVIFGFACGMCLVGAVLYITEIRTSTKVLKNRTQQIYKSNYEYEVFEQHICVNVYREDERTFHAKFLFADIEQIHQLGKWLVLQIGEQFFVIRKSDLKENSAISSYMHENPAKTFNAVVKNRWEYICITSNIILSVIYALGGWLPGVLGLFFFSLGFSDQPFVAFCCILASLLFLLTPVFCIFGVVFSVLLRKKKAYVTSFMIQFLPFAALGIALVSFFLSII